jgi:hypothetical protein
MGQVRDLPRVVVAGQSVDALLDGVLVRAGERRVHEVAHVRVTGVHRQAVAVLGHSAQGVDVGDVELRVDALAEQVHRQRHDVDVAGALPVAEQRALDPVGAGHHTQLGGRHGAPAVVVGMERQDDAVAVHDVPVEVLDDVGVDVGRVHLHRGRQVEDQLAIGRRLDDLGDGVTDLDGVVDLRAGEALGAVLVEHVGLRDGLLELAAQPGRRRGDVGDAVLVEPEHDPPLEHRRRVVEVDDGLGRALDALVGALDQLGPALGEYLDRDVVGDQVLLDEDPDEVEVRLARRREPDLDLLEPHRRYGLEHAPLADRVHGVDQRLVAVPEVDGAPGGGPFDPAVGPLAVGEGEGQRDERRVLLERHLVGGGVGRGHRCLLVARRPEKARTS